MKRNFTLLLVLLCLYGNKASAQLVQSCFLENFNSQTSGWTYSQGANEGNYNTPGTCTPNRGIVTPGIGGNNPANIKTPVFTSNGALTMQVQFDIYCVNSNLNCNSWKNFDCPTSIDVFYHVGGVRYIAIQDLVLPPNGPGNSPKVNFMFNTQNRLPAGTQYQLEIAFKMKSGIGNCGQPGTKYILDNFGKCEINCLDCAIDAIDDIYCQASNNAVTFSGNLALNDTKYDGAVVTYSLANGPFANGNAAIGGANLSIQSDGQFTITRTDMTKSIFDFTYRITESTFGMTDLASVRVCFPEGSTLPVILTEFNASRKNKTVLLTWKTSMELNAASFEIERLTGTQFEKVGSVIATNDINGSSYSFTDQNSFSKTTMYRLKQIDKDNTYKHSEVRTVKGIGADFDFQIYPNPATGGRTRVHFDDVSETLQIQVMDQTGRVLKNMTTANRTNIDIQGLVPGMYYIKVTKSIDGSSAIKKLIVIQ